MKNKGNLIVISGPSGTGKGTVCKELLKAQPEIVFSISATTRKPRPGEVNGKDYWFLSKEEFQQMIAENRLLEWAEVYGNYYGTLREEVESRINSGQNVILEIDVQGGLIVKEKNSEAILVFFKAPNMEVLAKRLEDRKTDTKEVIELRLANAKKELEYETEYDYTVVNDNLEKACQELINIINK
jgi:guanylate kinase